MPTLPRPRLPAFDPLQMVIAIALLLLALFAYAGVQTARQQHLLAQQQHEVELEVARLQQQIAELEGLREYLASDEYIEAVARSRFGLVRPGETAIVVEDHTTDEEPLVSGVPDREPGERWWEALFGR